SAGSGSSWRRELETSGRPRAEVGPGAPGDTTASPPCEAVVGRDRESRFFRRLPCADVRKPQHLSPRAGCALDSAPYCGKCKVLPSCLPRSGCPSCSGSAPERLACGTVRKILSPCSASDADPILDRSLSNVASLSPASPPGKHRWGHGGQLRRYQDRHRGEH